MNLYKIIRKTWYPTDKCYSTGIITYLAADNESEVYDYVNELAYWSDWDLAELFARANVALNLTESEEELEKMRVELIIANRGEINAPFKRKLESYYSTDYYGWELVKENIDEEIVEILTNLNICPKLIW